MSAGPTLSVRTADVLRLQQLSGEVGELERAGSCPREHFVKELAALVDADIGIFLVGRWSNDGDCEVRECIDIGWRSAKDRAQVFSHLVAHGDPLTAGILARHASKPQAVRRRDVIRDREWYESELHRDVHALLRLDDVLIGIHSLSPTGALRSLVFKKRAAARPFSEQDRDLIHLALLQGRCFDAQRRPRPPECLTPREQQVWSGLLSSSSEKQLAATLGVSSHTLHGYVKNVYRKLEVRSRAELLSRYLPTP